MLAERLSKPERPKGSTPTSRAVAERARDGSQDPIAMRRIKHLRRCCVEERNRRGGGANLSVVQSRHWRAFVHDKVSKGISKIPSCQRSALAMLDTAASELAKVQAAAKVTDWRRSFRPFGVQALRLGAKIVKPTAAPPIFSQVSGNWKLCGNVSLKVLGTLRLGGSRPCVLA